MKAFDTDVLTEVLLGNEPFVQRAEAIPPDEQAVPILVIEEMIRGRLQVIRQREAGKTRVDLEKAYRLFEQTFRDLRQVAVLSYTSQAEVQFQQWRKQKLRVPTHDL